MTFRVETTPEADAQFDEIYRWWRINRSAASNLFIHELDTAFELLSRSPFAGSKYEQDPGTRRLLMRKTGYHLYYEVRSEVVLILAIWHGKRGTGPPLR